MIDFLDECCSVGDSRRVKKIDLFTAYSRWCRWVGEGRPMGKIVFYRQIQSRGLKSERDTDGHYFTGIDVSDTVRERIEQEDKYRSSYSYGSGFSSQSREELDREME